GENVVGGQDEPEAGDPVATPRKKAWEARFGGEVAARPHVAARVARLPRPLAVDPATLPPRDEAFLERLAGDTWRALAGLVDEEHALPVDNVRLGTDVRVGDYTNVTSVGLYLAAVAAAFDLEFIGRRDAVPRIEAVFATLDRLETHAGMFFNYYDTTTLERSSNFVSFVDSAWLAAGLVVRRPPSPPAPRPP